MKKLALSLLLVSVLITMSCDLPNGLGTATSTLKIVNNSGDDNIVIHFGDYGTQTSEKSTSMIGLGDEMVYTNAPLNRTVHIWYTHSEGNINWRTELISAVTGDTFEFLFEENGNYELRINLTDFEFYSDGIDINLPVTASVPDPVFSQSTTTFDTAFDLTLSHSNNSALLYYTTDGTSPQTSTTKRLYTSAIRIDNTTTVKAVALVGSDYSSVVTAVYTYNASATSFTPTIQSITSLISDSPFTISIDFGQEVSALALDSLTVTNGSASNLQTTDNIVYSVDITPDSDGDVTLELAADAVTSNSTGFGNALASETYDFDGLIPTATIRPTGESTTYYSPIEFEIIFSETISGLTSSDLSGSGTVGSLSRDTEYTGTGMRYTANVTPTTGGDITMAIQEGAVTDAAGNVNILTYSESTVAYTPIGKMVELEPTDNPQWVYAIDEDYMKLVKVDTVNQKIDSLITLPHPAPVALEYSSPDNMLYIAYEFRDVISRYDLDTDAFLTELDYNDNSTNVGETRTIEIAPVSRKIYILSPESTYDSFLSIIDMDDSSLISSGSVDGKLLAVTDSTGHIITGDVGLSPSTIFQYEMAINKDIVLVQSERLGGNGQHLSISPDENHMIFAQGGGNGSGYTMFDMNPSDYSQVSGVWDTGAYPRYGVFSHDSQYFYGHGSGLQVFDMNYIKMKTFTVPNQSDYMRYVPNSDGSTMVVFTYDNYSDNDHRFYFLTDIRP